MVRAFLRLVLITVATLILTVLAVFMVRGMGLRQGFSTPPHPWFQRSFWWVFTPTLDELCDAADLDARLPDPEWIVTLPVVRKEDVWFVPCAQPVAVDEFLSRAKHRDWILQISAHDTWSLDQLVAEVSTAEKDKAFAVMAESQKVSIYLRKKAPQWLFAADSASLLRFRTFESMWIETAMDFWPDFLVTSAAKDAFVLDERGIAEFKRRGKRVLWNWNENMGQKPPGEIQGILTNRPSAAQQIFRERL